MPAPIIGVPDPLSKSQRKKDMLDLQKLGEALIKLPAIQLAKISLPDELLRAIHEAHRLKTHESIRRHLQYVGKLMRHVDADAIRAEINQAKFTNDDRKNNK